MSEHEMLVGIMKVGLEQLTNDELSATDSAMLWGEVGPKNIAYDKLRLLQLIDESGKPQSSGAMVDAITAVFHDRVQAGDLG